MPNFFTPIFSVNIFLPLLTGSLLLSAFLYAIWIVRRESINVAAPAMLLVAELFIFLYQAELKINLAALIHTFGAMILVMITAISSKYKKSSLTLAVISVAVLMLPFIKNGLYEPILVLMALGASAGAVVGKISTFFGIVPATAKK